MAPPDLSLLPAERRDSPGAAKARVGGGSGADGGAKDVTSRLGLKKQRLS